MAEALVIHTTSKGQLPAVRLNEWPKNEIDAFILARLESEGLQPSPEADRATLIRRLSFDLTGCLHAQRDRRFPKR
ncbi:MAG: DUF1549 domain-containing protein [Acidobacteria bacterium]|nr:DUF1549 domain-containing protein [Acidobacteriota bacterium]